MADKPIEKSENKNLTVFIRRVKDPIKPRGVWFELLGHKKGVRVLVDFPGLMILKNSGVEVLDIEAVLLEMVRCN